MSSRLLKKSIRGLFQHAKQKARFLLCFIFQTLSVFEKWRYILIPHRRVMKNEFFITLLGGKRKGGTRGISNWPIKKLPIGRSKRLQLDDC